MRSYIKTSCTSSLLCHFFGVILVWAQLGLRAPRGCRDSCESGSIAPPLLRKPEVFHVQQFHGRLTNPIVFAVLPTSFSSIDATDAFPAPPSRCAFTHDAALFEAPGLRVSAKPARSPMSDAFRLVLSSIHDYYRECLMVKAPVSPPSPGPFWVPLPYPGQFHHQALPLSCPRARAIGFH